LGGPIAGILRHKSHLLWPWLADLVRRPVLLDAVEDLIGPDILVWGSNLFVKDAHDPAFVSWHQDSTYWGLSEPAAVTAWVAFSPSTRESGCLRVSPGSHRVDELPHLDNPTANNLLTRGQEVQVRINDAIDVVLAPGEMSLHHVRAIHGSNPNRSDDRRIGFAIRYIPTRVRQRAGRDFATLMRGRDAYGHFGPEPVPATDLDPAAVAAHAKIMRVVGETPAARRQPPEPAVSGVASRIAADIGGTFTDLAIMVPGCELAAGFLEADRRPRPHGRHAYRDAALARVRAGCAYRDCTPKQWRSSA
jgi:ectoine hydroxylase-related dioxygenase (phytanoyl-CoA dioxygenase family)